jgi:hypothetical protein
MPVLSKTEAAEELVRGVENAKPSVLVEIYCELFPDAICPTPPVARDIVKHIRSGLEAEEIVDLWNVVFPADSNVRYDEEDQTIHYNEEVLGYVD